MSDTPRRPRNLVAEINRAVADPNLDDALFHAVTGVNERRRQVTSRFPGYEEARDQARRVKEAAIAELPGLIERFSETVERQGGRVHQAEDGEAACQIITALAKQHGAQRVTKSKSMTSEEIHLNGAMEAAGIEVRETDLGEYILQLSGDRPSHITAPIIHMTIDDVRQVFGDSFDMKEVPETPEELTRLAREKLRKDFLDADLGITGANFLLADTGTVVVVENEGNGRMTTQVPPAHVVLAGVDKLIPRAADLLPFLQLLPRSATGQLFTSYLSFFSGPGWTGSPMSPGRERTFDVVLLDNGRMAMRDDPLLAETLYCIRCGGCMTVCPPYQVVGGHVYGGPTYHSGIGNAWEAGLRGLDTAAEFNDLCTSCTRCQDACPVRIDIPWMNMVLRERIAERRRRPRRLLERLVYDRLLPTDESGSVSLARRLFSDPARAYRLARRSPASTLMRLGPLRSVLGRAAGLAAERPLPLPAGVAFTDWNRRRGGRSVSSRHQAQQVSNDRRGSTVFLLADCHTEHVDTEVGKAAVAALEKCGLTVVLVSGQCCGRAALSQGMLRTARRQAKALQQVLEPLVTTGHSVVGVEPSCVGALVDDHPKLLPGGRVGEVVADCHEILDFINRRFQAPADGAARRPQWKPAPQGHRRPLLLHGHCQQKTMGWLPGAVELLGRVPGYELRVTTAECCGMAGSFGYKGSYYPISAVLGRRLAAEIEGLEGLHARASDSETTAPDQDAPQARCELAACGTSCRAQISDICDRRARHPIELVAERLSDPSGRRP